MKILFIYPSMGEMEKRRAIKLGNNIFSSYLEPLPIATISGLTPKHWKKSFFDDRIEEIDYSMDCDLVAISVETFSARRAYEIALNFKKKGKTVIMGGFHVSILPDEALKYCDSVLIGEAEDIFGKMLRDFEKNKLKRKYSLPGRGNLSHMKVDRTVYGNRKYLPITMIETGRGCKFRCEFCSVSLFFKGDYMRRPISHIIEDVKSCKKKFIIFADDNICGDIPSAKLLFKELIPLKVKWISSASINIVNDDELLDLMKASGCTIVLLGIESLDSTNLKLMNKKQNYLSNLQSLIEKLNERGIKIYGSFVLGYENESAKSVKDLVDFAIKNKFVLSNFYQLQPFPGTDAYKRLESERRLLYRKWWLNPEYRIGDVVFKPSKMNHKDMAELCKKARRNFYGYSSIFKRSFDCKMIGKSLHYLLYFYLANLLSRKIAYEKQGTKLGRENIVH